MAAFYPLDTVRSRLQCKQIRACHIHDKSIMHSFPPRLKRDIGKPVFNFIKRDITPGQYSAILLSRSRYH